MGEPAKIFHHREENPDLIRGLLEAVDRLREDFPESRLGAGGSWSSPKVLCSKKYRDYHTIDLMTLIRLTALTAASSVGEAPVQGWKMTGWANVMREGDSVKSHNHYTEEFPNEYSAIFYLQAESSMGGWITFEYEDGGLESVRPEPGLLLLFPATLMHRVEEYRGKTERISLAFNLSKGIE